MHSLNLKNIKFLRLVRCRFSSDWEDRESKEFLNSLDSMLDTEYSLHSYETKDRYGDEGNYTLHQDILTRVKGSSHD
jgi:hypothetical protein